MTLLVGSAGSFASSYMARASGSLGAVAHPSVVISAAPARSIVRNLVFILITFSKLKPRERLLPLRAEGDLETSLCRAVVLIADRTTQCVKADIGVGNRRTRREHPVLSIVQRDYMIVRQFAA